MRTLSADYIYTPDKGFLPKGIIRMNDAGEITQIFETHGNLQETSALEYYNGILIPGFVNAHCHLELSHMKGIMSRGKKLHGFVSEILKKRFTPENLQDILERADMQMRSEGIVAAGDISNTDDSFAVKRKSSLYYYNFIELFTTDDKNIQQLVKQGKAAAKKPGSLPGNFTPHAPYTVSDKLFEEINRLNAESDEIISMHNQETAGENELFLNQSGPLYDTLKNLGFNYDNFRFDTKNSLESTLPKLPADKNILLIHNTFTREKDIDFAENYSDSVFWVFCPASNLYIEEQLPDLPLFFEKGIKTCVGTDSLASNDKLSVLRELKIIHQYFPEISLSKLLDTATLNGAEALKIDKQYGSLSKGKKPGINLLKNMDYKSMQLTDESDVQVIA